MHRINCPLTPLFPLVAICFAGCDDSTLGEDGALEPLSVETEREPRTPASRAPLTAPAREADLDAISDDPDASDYVIVGPDDVDGFGWEFGFGVGERVPKDTLTAQRAFVDRIHELYEAWRKSGQHPQEFVRLHSDELRRLSHGFSGMEAVDPTGPAEGTLRISRGGSFKSTGAANLRTTFRAHVNPQDQLPGVGFRCASID